MRIELENLEDGRGGFAHTYQPEELGLSDERVTVIGPVSVDGRVKRSGAEVTVSGAIAANLEVVCDRCLKPVQVPIANDFQVDYITGSEYESSHNAELTEQELAVSVFDGEGIDVDELVREQILLSVPNRTLCREDCKGMCPTCGADLNAGPCNCEPSDIDPRWDALKKLKQ